jgi:hypothetical protein
MLGGRRKYKDSKPLFRKDQIAVYLGRLLGIVVLLWFLFVFLPELFHAFFHTLLGNIMLVLIVILAGLRTPVFALVLAILFFFLFRSSQHNEGKGRREGFLSFPKKYEGYESKMIPGLTPSIQAMIEKAI